MDAGTAAQGGTAAPDPARRRRETAAGVAVVAVVAAAAAVALVSSRGPDVEPAPEGSSRDCADLLRRLPRVLDAGERRELTLPGVAQWEGVSETVLRCGVPPPGPSELPCLSFSGRDGVTVDWLLVAQSERASRFVSFGRTPAVEVTADATGPDATAVLVDLGPALAPLPVDRRCR
ncbi:uncharacterized protein DUF3515 [Kineococcus xinjiangensis]|uniref:Uncharacterized protein DUF3515 n=1 Tax=Kineococcus xinjiangensis TaxID=512762 RepID=A0A2S6IW12_9ACTN|nr:DUF3515 family protein [Kineococcus xinjiangensis]PPK98552.1 uncharacterized protein DUF3515 [Kineococcus xinjiangensis]